MPTFLVGILVVTLVVTEENFRKQHKIKTGP
jgi:hypothetical protein